jgi:hypothetical protein
MNKKMRNIKLNLNEDGFIELDIPVNAYKDSCSQIILEATNRELSNEQQYHQYSTEHKYT